MCVRIPCVIGHMGSWKNAVSVVLGRCLISVLDCLLPFDSLSGKFVTQQACPCISLTRTVVPLCVYEMLNQEEMRVDGETIIIHFTPHKNLPLLFGETALMLP